MKRIVYILFAAALLLAADAGAAKRAKSTMVRMKTSMGEIKVMLYDDTPLHRDNFIANVRAGRYDGVLFHRVIRDFMVQSGDFNSVGAAPGIMLGEDSVKYTIPAEFRFPERFHRPGALAAARDNNPEKASSPAQFYIVTGKKFTAGELDRMEQSGRTVKLPGEVRKVYMTQGGTPHLDDRYTVFGQVVCGMEVVDRIQRVSTDRNDRPGKDVRILKARITRCGCCPK